MQELSMRVVDVLQKMSRMVMFACHDAVAHRNLLKSLHSTDCPSSPPEPSQSCCTAACLHPRGQNGRRRVPVCKVKSM